MRKLMTALVLASLAMSGSAISAKQTLAQRGEAKLAKMLEGREAGEPVSCIPTMPTPNLTVIDRTALVYGSGSTIYVNRTQDPRWIDQDNILVSRPTNASQLCKLDSVYTMDRTTHMRGGAVMLVDFVPYKRIKGSK